MIDPKHFIGVPRIKMAVLMLSVFTVSMGFGIVLPALPFLLDARTGGDVAQVSRDTGLLTGLYTFSLFLFAPAWGRLSDRHGRRGILLLGLLGFSVTSLAFAFFESLSAIYAERFLSGLFAAAVTPVALAAVADLAGDETARARGLTFVSIAGVGGFLLGPMMGVFIARSAVFLLPGLGNLGTLVIPLSVNAVIALLAALAVVFFLPMKLNGRASTAPALSSAQNGSLVLRLLALAFIVSAAVGVFEVGLALRGKQELGLTQYQIALMFTECSLVMLVVQAIVFSPLISPATTRWLIVPSFAILAVGLFLIPRASDFTLMLVATGAVAASAGILSPILTYWISSKAGAAQGAQLGQQTGAASLGAAIGATAGGILFDVAWLPNASFILVTVVILIGAALSIRLPGLLVSRYVTELGAGPRSSHH